MGAKNELGSKSSERIQKFGPINRACKKEEIDLWGLKMNLDLSKSSERVQKFCPIHQNFLNFNGYSHYLGVLP